jgi:hypothetical protein
MQTTNWSFYPRKEDSSKVNIISSSSHPEVATRSQKAGEMSTPNDDEYEIEYSFDGPNAFEVHSSGLNLTQ